MIDQGSQPSMSMPAHLHKTFQEVVWDFCASHEVQVGQRRAIACRTGRQGGKACFQPYHRKALGFQLLAQDRSPQLGHGWVTGRKRLCQLTRPPECAGDGGPIVPSALPQLREHRGRPAPASRSVNQRGQSEADVEAELVLQAQA